MRKNLFISAVFVFSSIMLSAQNSKIQHGFQVEFGLALISGSNDGVIDNFMGSRYISNDDTDHTIGYSTRGLYSLKYRIANKLYFLTGLGVTYHREHIFVPPSRSTTYISMFLTTPILLEYRPVKFFALEGGLMLSSNIAFSNARDNGSLEIMPLDFPVIEPDLRAGFKFYFAREFAIGFSYNHGLFPYSTFDGDRFVNFPGSTTYNNLRNFRSTIQIHLSKFF